MYLGGNTYTLFCNNTEKYIAFILSQILEKPYIFTTALLLTQIGAYIFRSNIITNIRGCLPFHPCTIMRVRRINA